MRVAVIGNGDKLMITDIAHEMATVIVEGAVIAVNQKMYLATVMSGDSAELTRISEEEAYAIGKENAALKQNLSMLTVGSAHVLDHCDFIPPRLEKNQEFYDHYYKPNKNKRR